MLPSWTRALRLPHAVVCKLNLPGRIGLDDRAAACFDPTARSNSATRELLLLDARRGKCALKAPLNDDAARFNPTSPKNHINSVPPLSHADKILPSASAK
jgi:hypothetical protein